MSVKEGQVKQIEQLQRSLDAERTRRYELEALLAVKQEWVSLTDEEMTELVLSQGRFGTRLGYVTRTEAKLKEKNGG